MAYRILKAALFLLLLAAREAYPQAYTLTTVLNPMQGGQVAPNCSVGCLYDSGTAVKLLALPSEGHVFGGWSGDCAGSAPAASLFMTTDRECTADFLYCGGLPVEIGSAGYSGLSAAYAVASDGDTMKMLASNLQESPDLNRQVEITLAGGYGCGFGSNPSMTLLTGPLTVGKGSVTVENLILVGSLSAAAAIAPAIPTLPADSGFDHMFEDPAVTGDVTQIENGTPARDRIIQYGGTGVVVQTATGDSGNDWILQVCGGTSCEQTVDSGSGIDTVYQYGRPGATSQFIEGSSGVKTYVQAGGASPNTQIAFGSTGFDRIFQYGGATNDLMSAEGDEGNDRIEQYGQGGNDTIATLAGTGNDKIYQDGGDGDDNMSVEGAWGDDVIVQKGGLRNDSINCLAGMGDDSIQIAAGAGNDTIYVAPDVGYNAVNIDAGPGDDTITYRIDGDQESNRQIDTSQIDGGERVDTICILHYLANPVYRIIDGAGSTIYETGSGGSLITVSNMEFLIDYGDTASLSNNVTFTLTFASGSLNSAPAGADKVTISMDASADTSVYRLTPELGSAANPLRVSFVAVAGNHSYTVNAWSGNTLLATIGPISFTTVDNFPLTIPLAFSFPAFDSYHTDIGEATSNTFTYLGTEARNRVVQYGGAANDTLSVDTGAGNDWCEQYGGDGYDNLIADKGTGDDFIYQDGGAGSNNLLVQSADGDDQIIQKGGAGADSIKCDASDGNDTVRQEGGAGNDTIGANGGYGNDSVVIDAGPGNDSVSYDVSWGTDSAFIDGGTGTDTLAVNRNGQSFVLRDSSGSTLYQYGSGGTVITVANLEQVTVLD